jgi:pimeloyl-ACP methyl ester carboxylesterase
MLDGIEQIIRQPAHRRHETPLLWLHGAWHGAWCWENWLAYFSTLGYQVRAISLPRHGGSPLARRPINLYTLGDYVAVLAEAVAAMSPTPVVVGHSLGGAVLQKYLQTYPLPAAVLLASIPARRILPMVLRLLRRHPAAILQGLLTCRLYHWVATPERVRDLFLSADSTLDVAALQRRLVNESLLTGIQTLLPFARYGQVKSPVLVITGDQDRLFTVAEARATAAQYQAETVVFQGQPHHLMLESDWRRVADTVDQWISGRLQLP